MLVYQRVTCTIIYVVFIVIPVIPVIPSLAKIVKQLEDGPRDRPRRAGSNDHHGGHESWFDDWMIDGT
jgi:hypothetical protein